MPNIKRQTLLPGGFTLIEVLIAIVIIGITMIAIGMVMRTAVRSWQIGHAVSETTQTIRITEDVVQRDLNNLFYMKESDYNASFRHGIEQFGQLLDVNEPLDPGRDMGTYRKRKRDKQATKLDEAKQEKQLSNMLDSQRIGDITPPIDLSFTGADGGQTDTLTFTRRHDPRWVEEPATWGLRRVTYSVRDSVLYRSEEDPFGLGKDAAHNYAGSPAMQLLLQMFQRPAKGQPNPNPLGVSMLPEAISIEEPLCEGVEVFDLTYGYFKANAWHEVTNWDSGSTQYRGLPRPDSPEFKSMTAGMTMDEINMVTPMVLALGNQPEIEDDLPAYMALQVGVRLQGGPAQPAKGSAGRSPANRGKLYSYTFYHSFPQSQETDQYMIVNGKVLRTDTQKDRGRRRRNGDRQ